MGIWSKSRAAHSTVRATKYAFTTGYDTGKGHRVGMKPSQETNLNKYYAMF